MTLRPMRQSPQGKRSHLLGGRSLLHLFSAPLTTVLLDKAALQSVYEKVSVAAGGYSDLIRVLVEDMKGHGRDVFLIRLVIRGGIQLGGETHNLVDGFWSGKRAGRDGGRSEVDRLRGFLGLLGFSLTSLGGNRGFAHGGIEGDG